MLELLFLLLPIAAAYGWYMGNRSAKQDKQEKSHQISREYVRGLNLLLSEQSDKAVDHFIELLQVDDETIDTHLALGNLFRSRGEVDRAIRLHQNLITREGLTIDQKHIALQQLAKDYMVSGIFDRAEKILEQLIDEPEHRQQSLEQLMQIYQQTSEWDKAIRCGESLLALGKKRVHRDIAHFRCELAMQALASNETKQAIKLFKKALQDDSKCVRASIGLGNLYLEQRAYQKTIDQLEMVIRQDLDFVSEVLPTIADCYYALDDEQGLLNFLQTCINRKTGASAELMLAQILAKHEGIAKAQTMMTAQLEKNPTMKGFYRLIDYHIAEAEEGRARDSLTTIQSMVGEQMKLKPHYQCRQCGFASQSVYWHCPSCKKWGSIKPIRGLDGE